VIEERYHATTQTRFYPDISNEKQAEAVQLQTGTGPEVSRKLRLSDFVTTAQDDGRLSVLRSDHL